MGYLVDVENHLYEAQCILENLADDDAICMEDVQDVMQTCTGVMDLLESVAFSIVVEGEVEHRVEEMRVALECSSVDSTTQSGAERVVDEIIKDKELLNKLGISMLRENIDRYQTI